MKLGNLKRLLRDDLPDIPAGEWADIWLANQNQANEQITQALQGALTFNDNMNAGFGVYRLTHGVTSTINVPDGFKGRPAWVEPCRSIAVSSSTRQPIAYIDWEHVDNTDPKAPARVKVTPYFQRTVSAAIGTETRSAVPVTSPVSLVGSPAAAKTITSISLTAGIHDLNGVVSLDGTLTGTNFTAAISTVDNTLPATSLAGDSWLSIPTMPTAAADCSITIPQWRVTPTVTTTYYLVAKASFTVGTGVAYGRISAVRQADAYSDTAPVANVVLFFSGG